MESQNERPEVNTTYNTSYIGAPQFLITSTNRTTHNSSVLGPGFRPNYQGIQRYNLLERLRKETENIKSMGATLKSLDGWEPLPKIPGLGTKGLLVSKTIDGSVGHSLEVILYMDNNGNLYFTSDGGNFEIKKNGINDIFTFYTRAQNGGFYPSVYGGITGAKMLTPLIARQMLRMYESRKTRKTRKHKSKKLSRKKTRLNA